MSLETAAIHRTAETHGGPRSTSRGRLDLTQSRGMTPRRIPTAQLRAAIKRLDEVRKTAPARQRMKIVRDLYNLRVLLRLKEALGEAQP